MTSVSTTCAGVQIGVALPCRGVRIASWNVNSIKQRVPRFLPWLDERRPDVVCLQETKLTDEAFLELLDEVVKGIDGAPGFPHPEARAVSATCGGIRAVSVYVPNGRAPDSEHYQYK